MTRKYFGTDGIRGKANEFPMTADMAMKVAMASALVLKQKKYRDKSQNRVVIGKDTRLSCYMFEQAMAAGFLSMGMDVVLLGPIPTPAVAMLTRSLRADLGVMISASHNPYEDNGIKLFGPDGYKLDDAIETDIEKAIDEDLSSELSTTGHMGKASRLDDAPGRYVEFVKSTFPRGQNLQGLKVVVDCANGAGYKVAPQVLWELEADVVPIGDKPNGKNINAQYGATATDNLAKEVVAHQADIGLALDGDADRVILIDEKGQVVDGDQILALLGTKLKQANQLSNDAVVATVMSNLGLERYLQQQGISLQRTQVGDRYVVELMKEKGYNIGGEQSGHIVMSDYGSTGDGLMAGLQVLGALNQSDKPASEFLTVFKRCPQILKNIEYKAGQKPLENAQVNAAIADAEKVLGDSGRVLVRASGTQALIRVMAEGDEQKAVENAVNHICAVIGDVCGGGNKQEEKQAKAS